MDLFHAGRRIRGWAGKGARRHGRHRKGCRAGKGAEYVRRTEKARVEARERLRRARVIGADRGEFAELSRPGVRDDRRDDGSIRRAGDGGLH